MDGLDEFSTKLLNALADGVSILDGSGQHLFVNDRLCEMTGFAREELLGSAPPHPYWPVEQLQNIEQAFELTLTDHASDFELVFQTKSGDRFPVSVNPSTIQLEGDVMFVATVKDLTFVKQQSRDVSIAQNLLKAVSDGGDVGSWEWPLLEDGDSPLVSDNYFALLGYPPGAWIPSYDEWAKRVHPDDIGVAEKSIQALWSGESILFDVECRMLDFFGEWQWILSRAYITERDQTGAPVRISGTLQNINRLKGQEGQIKGYQKMEVLGQLTGGIAHDFNNLLAIIGGNLELIESRALPDIEKFVANAQKGLDRASLLTASLLQYSRNNGVTLEALELSEFIDSLDQIISIAIPKSIKFEVEKPDSRVYAKCESGQLENALLNLLVNARDAILPESGTIKVALNDCTLNREDLPNDTFESGSYAKLSVSDDGRGMDEQTLARATEPQFTTKKSGSGSGSGTGLGLSMVQKTIRDSGGFMQIESVPERGTQIHLFLPRL